MASNESTKYKLTVVEGTELQLSLSGRQGPTGATGATGAAGPNTITTSTTTSLNGYIYGNGATVGGATSASSSGTPNTLVLRDGDGRVSFSSGVNNSSTIVVNNTGATIDEDSYAIYANSTGSDSGGGFFQAESGFGLIATSTSAFGLACNSIYGIGASITSNNGTYHAKFGESNNDISAIERVRGWFVWFYNNFIGRLKTADITANRDWTLPNASGTVALIDSPQTFSQSQTFSGAISFTNSTRPTSSATGSPATTSLMTRNDTDNTAFDDFGRIFYVRQATFGSSGTNAGAAASFPQVIAAISSGTTAAGYGRATIYRGFTTNPALSGAGINFSSPISLALKVAGATGSTTSRIRLVIGGNGGVPVSADSQALSVVGFGIEFALNASNFITYAPFAHNGTTYNIASPTVTTITQSSFYSAINTFAIISNGSGTITAQHKNGRTIISESTITGGPTTLGVLANSYADVVAVNSATNPANASLQILDAVIKLY